GEITMVPNAMRRVDFDSPSTDGHRVTYSAKQKYYRGLLVHYTNTGGDTGEATANGSTTSLTTTTAGLIEGRLVNCIILFTEGQNTGAWRRISANTTTSISWSGSDPLAYITSTGDDYEIRDTVRVMLSPEEPKYKYATARGSGQRSSAGSGAGSSKEFSLLEFAGNNGKWPADQKGMLLRRSDAHGNMETYAFDTSLPGGRNGSVTTSQGWQVIYDYIDDAPNSGRIRSILASKTVGGPAFMGEVNVLHDDVTYDDDCGTAGDLLMVHSCEDLSGNGSATSKDGSTPKSRLNDTEASYDDDVLIGDKLVMIDGENAGQIRTVTDNGDEWIVVGTDFDYDIDDGDSYMVVRGEIKTTVYRYYRDGDDDGVDNQLKMVLEPDAVQAIIDDGGSVVDAEDILHLADDAVITGSKTLEEYASRSFKYYTGNLITDDVITGTPWGGNDDLDEMYLGDSDASDFNETGFVKSETISGRCGSCGGSGAVGITRTYYYMDQHGGPDATNPAPTHDKVVRVVVEDTVDSSSNPAHRKIFGLNKSGVALREVLAIDPPPATPKYWCKSRLVGADPETPNQVNQTLQRRMPSAHVSVTTHAKIAQFLDPTTGDDPTNDEDTLEDSTGLIYVYGLDVNGRRTETKVGKGETGADTPYFVSARTYGNGTASNQPSHLPVETYAYTSNTEQTKGNGILTTISYIFWDGSDPTEGECRQIKIKTINYPKVPTSENGRGDGGGDPQITRAEYYDSKGRLRLTKDGEGNVDYYAYDVKTGGLAYTVVDIKTDGAPTAATSPPGGAYTPWSDVSGDLVSEGYYDFSNTDGGNLAETTYVYDDLGRRTRVVDPAGVITYTVYGDNQTLVFPAWKADGANSVSLLPIQVTETNCDGEISTTYTVDPDRRHLNGSNEPDGLADGTTTSHYFTRTVYNHNDNGQLTSVDRYWDCDVSTSKLTTSYTYYDDGLQKKVTAPDGTVTETLYDALGRVKETKRGTAGNEQTVSKKYYDGATSATLVEGDGNVTRVEVFSGSATYTTDYVYDYRNRQTKVRGSDSVAVVKTLDGLGRTTTAIIYANTTFASGDVGNATNANRRAKTEIAYNQRGQLYKTVVYEVDPSTGTPGDSLTAEHWYDDDGRRIKTQGPNTFDEGIDTYYVFSKYVYDAAGRLTDTYLAYDDETGYAAADDMDPADHGHKIPWRSRTHSFSGAERPAGRPVYRHSSR
ncbi:hypothetical protein LCGC14_1534300, partial [marine sediment metagenome]